MQLFVVGVSPSSGRTVDDCSTHDGSPGPVAGSTAHADATTYMPTDDATTTLPRVAGSIWLLSSWLPFEGLMVHDA
jgi:hypothetical protein